MIVPGSNLLTQAHNLIGRQTLQWLAYAGMTTLADGSKAPSWAAPVTVRGSFQPASRNMIQQLGLDWNKDYHTFYNERAFKDVERDITGDRLVFAGRTYQIESKTPWFQQDGWESVLCAKVTNA